MLARGGSLERRGEVRDALEKSVDSRAPIRTGHVDEGVHMHVSVSGVIVYILLYHVIPAAVANRTAAATLLL